MFVIEGIEIIAYIIEDDASCIQRPFFFIEKESQLEEEMLLIFKSCRGEMDIVAVLRQMYLIESSLSRKQSVLHYQRCREVFWYHLPCLKYERLYYLGNLFRSKSCVTQFLSSIINTLQALPDNSVVRVIFFYVGMRERESIIEDVCLAEKEIFLSRYEFIFYPFKTFKPDQFYRACLVGECSADASCSRLAMSLHVRDSSDKLVIDSVVINLVYLMYFAAVNISEREIFEKVLKCEYPEFFVKKLGTFRTHAFQEFYFCLKNIDHFDVINFGL